MSKNQIYFIKFFRQNVPINIYDIKYLKFYNNAYFPKVQLQVGLNLIFPKI